MKQRLVMIAAGLQVLVLAWMAGEREWVLRTGKTIHLRTAPVDPQDVMRGDYVLLNYELNNVPRAYWRDGLTNIVPEQWPRRAMDTRVYAALQLDENDFGELAWLSDRRPQAGPYLRGRLERVPPGDAVVRYGLEAYFMEQGAALELEQGLQGQSTLVPLEMDVAVGANGLGILKQHRWSPIGLGMTLETVNAGDTNRAWRRIVVAAKIWCKNATTNRDIAVIDLPQGGSFALEPDSRLGTNLWRWVGAHQPPVQPLPEHVLLLRPGQSHTNRIDLTQPQWYVREEREAAAGSRGSASAVPLSDALQSWSVRFRLVYKPPGRAACAGLPHADLIWHGRLRSRAISEGGGLD